MYPASEQARSRDRQGHPRGLGSIDFIGAARTGLFVEQHPTNPGKVLLTQSKSNIGPLGRTQVFTKHEGHFQWCGVSRLTAELMAGSGRGPNPHAFLEAVCWLEEALKTPSHGPATLRNDAEEEGISFASLRRAKKALGIRSIKNGEKWDWQLPSLTILIHHLNHLNYSIHLSHLSHLNILREINLFQRKHRNSRKVFEIIKKLKMVKMLKMRR